LSSPITNLRKFLSKIVSSQLSWIFPEDEIPAIGNTEAVLTTFLFSKIETTLKQVGNINVYKLALHSTSVGGDIKNLQMCLEKLFAARVAKEHEKLKTLAKAGVGVSLAVVGGLLVEKEIENWDAY
jgi:hypothetical protein